MVYGGVYKKKILKGVGVHLRRGSVVTIGSFSFPPRRRAASILFTGLFFSLIFLSLSRYFVIKILGALCPASRSVSTTMGLHAHRHVYSGPRALVSAGVPLEESKRYGRERDQEDRARPRPLVCDHFGWTGHTNFKSMFISGPLLFTQYLRSRAQP